MERLNKYDKTLCLVKKLNWTKEIEKRSKLVRSRKYIILTIQNQRLWRWVIDKLISMDSHRIDFFQKQINKKLKQRHQKSDNRMHKEVANYIINGKQFVC